MAGPSWQDVQRRTAPARAMPSVPPPAAAAPQMLQEDPASPLGRLFAQRQALEQKMQRLTGADQSDPRTEALYQVRPMAERRAEHDAWQAERERVTQRSALDSLGRRRAEAPQPPPGREGGPGPAAADDAPPLRPTPGERLRRPAAGTPSDSRGFMGLRDKLAGLRRGFDDADRRLAAEGMDRERADLAEMQREMKLDKLFAGAEKLDKVFDRGSSIADNPGRAGELIEQDWLGRRDRIGGPDLQSYERGFKDRAARLFGVDTGTVDDLQERTERLRGNALEKRRAGRSVEEQDEARRTRAVERRREARDER